MTDLRDVFLLLFLQGEFDEDLLQLLVAVVDDELLETVVLQQNTYFILRFFHPQTFVHVPKEEGSFHKERNIIRELQKQKSGNTCNCQGKK